MWAGAPVRSPDFSEELQMKPETMEKLQNGFIILVAGVIIPPAIGFGLDLWVTKETADRMANQAVLAVQAKICVAQFTRDPGYQERLKEYKALDYSARNAFLEKGNWAKMPDEEKARDAVMQACASNLEALAQK